MMANCKYCGSPVEIKYHKRCNDCGKFVKKDLWVKKNHRWKQHALCKECLSGYDSPLDY